MTGSIAVFALLLAAAAPPAAKEPAAIRWESSFRAAVAKAKVAGKPVMIDFWAEWCGYCHELDRTTYRDPNVIRLSRRLVSVKVNAEGSAAEQVVAGNYLVSSLPTIAFVAPSGREIMRLGGYVGPEQFTSLLEEILKAGTAVVAWEAALDKDANDLAALTGLGLQQFEVLKGMARDDPRGVVPKAMLTDTKDLLTRALVLDKDAPVAKRKQLRRTLGLLKGAQGQAKEMEALLKEALALAPTDAEDAETRTSLGELYLQQGKNTEAQAAFRKAIKDHPGTTAAKRAQVQLEMIGQGAVK